MELTIGIINNDRAMKNDIHIGDQIRKKISEQGLTITEFAKRINRSREAVRGILQKKSINTELLSTISVASALFALIAACTNAPERSRYSEEQINSLALDSTLVLTPDNRSVEIVDANSFLKPQEFNLEELIKEIKVVPLETTDESLLDAIYKIIVTDSNIYIHDRLKGGGVAIFDQNGRFIKRLSHGQGPGEIYRLYDVSYDSEKRELVLYQHPFLLFYTSNGKFIEQKRLPFGFYNFHVIPDGYIFKTLDKQGNGHLGKFKDHTLFVTDKNFKLKSVALPFYFNNINYGGYNYLYHNYTFNITQRFVDTIYQYTSTTNQLDSKFVLDFEKKRLPDKFLEGSMPEFRDAIKNNNYYYFLGEYLETEHQDAFFLMNDYIGFNTIIYRDKKSKRLIGGTHAIYDSQKQIPSIGFPISSFRNYFISLHYPSSSDSLLFNSMFLSEKDKKIIANMKEDDNPLLIFFELKDF